MLNDIYFKTTCNIRPHFLGPMGGLKLEGPLYRGMECTYPVQDNCWSLTFMCKAEEALTGSTDASLNKIN